VLAITADSNIWISAFNFGGNPRRLIEMGDAQLIRVDTSEDIIDEVMRVLRVKFEWSEESLKEAKSQMNAIGHKVTPDRKLDAVAEDPTDNRILCGCAFSLYCHRG
jgi:predicted nucleic acid-binding protein